MSGRWGGQETKGEIRNTLMAGRKEGNASVLSRRSFLGGAASFLLVDAVNTSSTVPLEIIEVPELAEAEQIMRLLRDGESFEMLATHFSTNPSRAVDGYLGRMNLSAIRSGMQKAVKGIQPGGTTGIIQSPSGFAILKLVSEKTARRNERLVRAHAEQQARADYPLVTGVSGSAEQEGVVERSPKPPSFQMDLEVYGATRRKAVQDGISRLKRDLEVLSTHSQDPAIDRYMKMVIQVALAQMYCYIGEVEKAIQGFSAAYKLAGSNESSFFFEKVIGICELRRAFVDNSLRDHVHFPSIFPFKPGERFDKTSGSKNAIKHFLNYLHHNPNDLEEKWLLSLSYMTLGEYPQQAPAEYRISPVVFGQKESIGEFVDVAPRLGLDVFGTAGGAIMDDLDNDGFLDVVLSETDSSRPLHYFHNNGDGTFTNRTAAAHLTSQLGGVNLLQADYNNDGWLDILVLRGGWTVPVRNSLLRNNGDGTFTDVTTAAGLAAPATSTQTAAWLDFDNDGWLDLFVGNEHSPCQLFHNNGDGTFTDVARAAGVDISCFAKGVVAGDYDNDGWMDLYVSNNSGRNYLFHNNGNGTFMEVARDLHVERPLFSFPAWFFDYDNDGWLDLFVSNFIVSDSEVLRSQMKLPFTAETARLYRNVGGAFHDVTEEANLACAFMTMGANFGDVDNDGFLDIYLGTGNPSYASLVPNVLLHNQGGKHFVDITNSSRTGSLQKGHGVAIGDLLNDGEPVILAKIGGMGPGDLFYTSVFKRAETGNNWVDVKLVGVKSNRAGVGARIKVTCSAGNGDVQTIYRDVTSGGTFGASPLRQHIGLGEAVRIITLEVWWPASKSRQLFHDLGTNQFLEIHEFENECRNQKTRS